MEELLDDADTEVAPGLRASELVQLCTWPRFGGTAGLRRVVEDFQDNWDLVAERVSLDATATARLVRGRARRGSTRWPRRRCPPTTARPRCWPRSPGGGDLIVHDGDLGTMLAGLERHQEAHRQGPPRGNKAKLAGPRRRRGADALRADELALVDARPTSTWRAGGSTGASSSAPSPGASCSTAPASAPPPARSSSTTCSCSPGAC